MPGVQSILTKLANTANGTSRKVESQDDEDEQGKDLEGETSDHDVVADSRVLVLMGFRTGDTTTESLQNQRCDVARNKDSRIGQWLDARVLSTKRTDDAGKAEVDTSREEGWSDGEADDLDQKGIL